MYLICVLVNMRESMEKENFLLPIFSPEAFNAGNSLESFKTNKKVFLPSILKIFTLSICFQSVNFKSPPSLKFLNIWEDSNGEQSKIAVRCKLQHLQELSDMNNFKTKLPFGREIAFLKLICSLLWKSVCCVTGDEQIYSGRPSNIQKAGELYKLGQYCDIYRNIHAEIISVNPRL